MTARTLVSVIIPCFDQSRFLAGAIESVQPSATPYETIVIDDGSTEDVEAVAMRYPVRFVRQRNAGVSAARNAGLKLAAGRYVAFLDADDLLAPGWLDHGVSTLEQQPSCALVYGQITLIDADGLPLPTSEQEPQEPVTADHYRTLLRHNYIWSPGCVIYRRSALDRVGGYDIRRSGAADLELNLRVMREYPAASLGRIALLYRKHETSMSSNLALMFTDSIAALRAQRPYVSEDPSLMTALEQGLLTLRRRYGQKLLDRLVVETRAGNWSASVNILKVVLPNYPVGLSRRAFRWLRRSSHGYPSQAHDI